MKSDINKIKSLLYQRYPNVDTKLIDEIIEIYFSKMKEAIQTFKKPEISLLWGTLILKRGKCEEEIRVLETILGNRNNPEINKYSEKKLKTKEEKLNLIKQCAESYDQSRKEGKTMRHKKRKHETKSDHTK